MLCGLQAAPRFNLACPILGLPLPPPVLGAPDVAGRRSWRIPRGGAVAPSSHLVPLSPWSLPPSQVSAFAQSVSILGFPSEPEAIIDVIPRLLPCGSNANTSLFARTAPLALPLPFPQFFAPDLSCEGEIRPAAPSHEPRVFARRQSGDEVMTLPATAAIQSTPAIGPLVERVCDMWAEQRRAVERRYAAHWGADELAEITEDLLCLNTNYNPERYADESDGGEIED